MCSHDNLELMLDRRSETIFKLCLSAFYSPHPLPHLFLTHFVTPYFLLSAHIFIILKNVMLISNLFIICIPIFLTFTTFSLPLVVDSPTHFSHSGEPSPTDLVFVSELRYLSIYYTIPQLASCDHLRLLVTME